MATGKGVSPAVGNKKYDGPGPTPGRPTPKKTSKIIVSSNKKQDPRRMESAMKAAIKKAAAKKASAAEGNKKGYASKQAPATRTMTTSKKK